MYSPSRSGDTKNARPLLIRVIWLMNSVRYGPRSSMNVLITMRSRVQRLTSLKVCWIVLYVGGEGKDAPPFFSTCAGRAPALNIITRPVPPGFAERGPALWKPLRHFGV